MKKLSVIPVVLALALVVTSTASAKPPSFALWMAARDARVAHLVAPVEAKCDTIIRLSNTDDADQKAGECLTRGLLPLFAAPWTQFDRGIARISAPQTLACKRAIHAYWKAMHTVGAATLIYLRANQHTTVTEFNRDIHTGTLGTLSQVSDETKSHAIRVCG